MTQQGEGNRLLAKTRGNRPRRGGVLQDITSRGVLLHLIYDKSAAGTSKEEYTSRQVI